MSRRILITGSNGFIGKRLKVTLINNGYEVEEFNSVNGDIAETELNYADIEHVFHLAGKSFVPDSWKDPASFYRTNVSGTLNVLEYCRRTKAKLSFISSYVYGIPQSQPISESHPINPINPYGHSKLLAEELCDFYSKNFGIGVTIIRPFNIYGPFQSKHFLIPEILYQLYNKELTEVKVLDLLPRRDYLFVDDLIQAMIVLFESEKTGIYNVGSGYSLSVEEILKKIMNVAGTTKRYISKNMARKNEIPDVVADISKIVKETGWRPQYTFESGIKEILKSENL